MSNSHSGITARPALCAVEKIDGLSIWEQDLAIQWNSPVQDSDWVACSASRDERSRCTRHRRQNALTLTKRPPFLPNSSHSMLLLLHDVRYLALPTLFTFLLFLHCASSIAIITIAKRCYHTWRHDKIENSQSYRRFTCQPRQRDIAVLQRVWRSNPSRRTMSHPLRRQRSCPSLSSPLRRRANFRQLFRRNHPVPSDAR